MDLESAIYGRRSIRKYTGEGVPDDIVKKIVQMAVEAPSPGNQKGWHFYVIRDGDALGEMAEIVTSELESVGALAGAVPERLHGSQRSATWFKEAPAVIAVTTRVYRSRIDKTLLDAGYIDEEVDVLRCRPDLQAVGAAIQNMLLAAHANGYGTCWLTGPMLARPKLEQYLNIQPPEMLAALVALGRPEYIPPKPQSKPVEDFLTFKD
ncbi:MAG: nitroreductase family protein [Bacillota bacterium]